MITSDGPKLLEYNVRFGDPECQVLMARLRSDLVPALPATREGEIDRVDLRWREEVALAVVMATRGYPGTYPAVSHPLTGSRMRPLPMVRSSPCRNRKERRRLGSWRAALWPRPATVPTRPSTGSTGPADSAVATSARKE